MLFRPALRRHGRYRGAWWCVRAFACVRARWAGLTCSAAAASACPPPALGAAAPNATLSFAMGPRRRCNETRPCILYPWFRRDTETTPERRPVLPRVKAQWYKRQNVLVRTIQFFTQYVLEVEMRMCSTKLSLGPLEGA